MKPRALLIGLMLAGVTHAAPGPEPTDAQRALADAEKPRHGRPARIEPFEHGELAEAARDYVKAAGLYRPLAAQGGGHEAAQVRLAKVLMLEADGDAAGATAERAEAWNWAERAAGSGSWSAQALLAGWAYAGTGRPADTVEAGKWAMLVRANPERRALGGDDLDATLRYRIERALGPAGLQQAQARAAAFRVTPQPVAPSEQPR